MLDTIVSNCFTSCRQRWMRIIPVRKWRWMSRWP